MASASSPHSEPSTTTGFLCVALSRAGSVLGTIGCFSRFGTYAFRSRYGWPSRSSSATLTCESIFCRGTQRFWRTSRLEEADARKTSILINSRMCITADTHSFAGHILVLYLCCICGSGRTSRSAGRFPAPTPLRSDPASVSYQDDSSLQKVGLQQYDHLT